jgi:hypothetical protein
MVSCRLCQLVMRCAHQAPGGARRAGRQNQVWPELVREDPASRQGLLAAGDRLTVKVAIHCVTVAQDRAAWQAVSAGGQT